MLNFHQWNGKTILRLTPESEEDAVRARRLGFTLQPTGHLDMLDFKIVHRAVAFYDQSDDAVKQYLAVSKQLLDGSRAVAPVNSLQVPMPPGIKLDGYQTAAIQQAATRRSTLCAMATGLGKTAVALGVANVNRARRILIVCPRFLVENFVGECKKFMTGAHRIYKITKRGFDFPPYEGIYILPASRLAASYQDILRSAPFDMLIVDESTYYKNDKDSPKCSLRTRAMWGEPPHYPGVCARARQVLCLSATPASFPTEMYRQLEAVAPQALNGRNFVTFRDSTVNYVDTGYGLKIVGAKNPEAFLLDLRATGYMIRPRREEALSRDQLNERKWLRLALSANGRINELMDEEKKLFAKWGADAGNAPETDAEHIMSIRRELEESKVPTVVEYAMQLMERTDRLFITCLHRDVVDGIAEKLNRRKGITADGIKGGMNHATRERALRLFAQNTPGKRVIVGQLHATFVGLNELVAAHHMIITGVPWRYWELLQVTGRIDRRTQEQDCVFYHLIAYPNSLDEKILDGGVGVSKRVHDSVFDA